MGEREIDQEILQDEIKKGNISLILEDYQDIFSDFDPRSYDEKALSDDFLQECKRAVRDKQEGFELRLLMPGKKRNFSHETKIKKRLKEHFEKHYNEKQKELSKLKIQGAIWFILGTCLMITETFLYNNVGFIFTLLKVMLVPAGWFSFWEGLGKIFITAAERKPDNDFYRKMASAKIYFLNY
jgi:hypothetical protein